MVDKDNVLVLNSDGTVIKKISRNYRIEHIPVVQNMLYFSGVRCPYIAYFEILTPKEIKYSYSYIEGVHVNDLSKEIISAIGDLAVMIKKINFQSDYIINFFEKIDFYYNSIDWKIVDECIITNICNLIERYQDTKRIYQCDTLIHGDLDLSNIIWSGENYYFIDFDECCMAPEQMEWIVFWIRFLKNRSWKDEGGIYATSQLMQFDYMLIEAYFIKVIMEKLYLEQKNIIDINEEKQKEDSYISWMNYLAELQKMWRYGDENK